MKLMVETLVTKPGARNEPNGGRGARESYDRHHSSFEEGGNRGQPSFKGVGRKAEGPARRETSGHKSARGARKGPRGAAKGRSRPGGGSKS
ncbi:hypothetical protein ACSQ67_019167 [Phaseolus vulgaris]